MISISEINDFSEINVSKFKNTKYQYFIMFKCNHCSYQVDYKQNLTRHEKSKHRNNIPPTIVSVCENVEPASGNNQSNVAPTTQYGMEPTSHYESISAEIYPCEDTPKVSTAIDVDMQHGLGIVGAQDNQTVSLQEHKNIVEETYKWKDAYEGQNQVNIMKDKVRLLQCDNHFILFILFYFILFYFFTWSVLTCSVLSQLYLICMVEEVLFNFERFTFIQIRRFLQN